METRNKVAGIAALVGLGYWLSQLPKIKVLATGEESVEYKMSVNGKSVTGEFSIEDPQTIIPAGDNEHYFIATGFPLMGHIQLNIAVSPPEGGYKPVKEKWIIWG